jgi:hypothetical protein
LEPLIPWSSVKRKQQTGRVLEYADLALGRKRQRRAEDRLIELPPEGADDWE